ncbi:MAG: TetR family transcriptional regulator [Caldilineaceae bacterium]|nr:TetR family transcriptional regulator [Caldilineaceae bacterium]
MDQVEDKRTAILEATLRLISQYGFHGTAMSKVAKEAGVSAGIIYHYFASKDALIDELYRTLKRRSSQAMLAGFDADRPLRGQIRLILQNIFRYYIQHPAESAFVEQYTRSPYFSPAIEEEVKGCYWPVVEAFHRAQAEMLIKELPFEVVAALTLDVATSLAQKHDAGLVTMTDELIDRVVDASWEAIRR